MRPTAGLPRSIAVSATLAFAILTPTPTEAAGCKPGFVPRETSSADRVCVPPASRQRVAAENARAPLLWTPGSFGPKTCAAGYVWRAAVPTDVICVKPDIRTAVATENSLAPLRQAP